MATYTVIQDIEAEDKLFGPLSLKQFIFACLTILFGYLSFWSIINNVWFLLIFFLPAAIFFGMLAFPYSQDQPTEIWLMAKVRFYFRPRKKVWDQTGIKELVTITAPKKEEHVYTDGLTHHEIKSRLSALGETLDSRGWALKNNNINMAPAITSNEYIQQNQLTTSDRLINHQSQQAPDPIMAEVRADYDMYDQSNNATAQKFDQIIQQSESQHRDAILEKIESARSRVDDNTGAALTPPPSQSQTPATQAPQNDYWFMREQATPPPSHQADQILEKIESARNKVDAGKPERTPSNSSPQNTDQLTFNAGPVIAPGQKQTSNNKINLTEAEKATLKKIKQQKQRPNPTNSHLKTIKPLSQQDDAQDNQRQKKKQDKTSSQPAKKTINEKTRPKETADASNDTAKAVRMNLARDNNLSVKTISKEANKANGDDGEVVVPLH